VESSIGEALRQSERIFDDELASENAYVADIIAHTRRFRGKRLRPILLLLTGKTAGGLTPAHPVLAAVVEMIHTATLVHDDVLDGAEVRRHVATVNVRWNNETSVLYGDYLFTHAFHLAASLESALACRLIGRATNLVCEGELSQVRHRGDLNLTEDEYLKVIDGKTGALCSISCQLGALYSKAGEEQVEAANRFGLLLGRAFQIADDVLDLVGLEDRVGKTLGTDLSQEKLTLPTIRLLAQADAQEQSRLRRLLHEPDEHDLRTILKLCRERGTIDQSLRAARVYAAQAREALGVFSPSPERDLLAQMAAMSTERAC
jgi:octaprenyl-diphosphate synthase